MSLLTIQRSPTPPPDSTDSSASINESSNSQSQSEDFFAYKDSVVLQNQCGRRRSSVILETDTLQFCLKKTMEVLRKKDSLKLIVNLEKVNSNVPGYRYFCLISTHDKTDQEEFAIIGINVVNFHVTIGMVIPIYQDVSVKLDGDGGFQVCTSEGNKLFKPTSVHSLWTTVQLLNKACSIANRNNSFKGGLNHTWIGYYLSRIQSSRAQIAEWNKMIHADTKYNSQMAPDSGIGELVSGNVVTEETQQKEQIRKHLRLIMRDEDMDTVTVITLRSKLQEQISFDVSKFRPFIAEEILIICGQMDRASQILPHLFLGSTFNASNYEELVQNKVTHILNVTCETENFFREKFKYKNIEVLDKDETQLQKYFDSCHKFINEVKDDPNKGTCLVHCQRGISRSATVVISYVMKELNLRYVEALKYVKEKRECVRPNEGFEAQLLTYEGIIQASAHRHNLMFNELKSTSRNEMKSCIIDSYLQMNYGEVIESGSHTVPKACLVPKRRSDSILQYGLQVDETKEVHIDECVPATDTIDDSSSNTFQNPNIAITVSNNNNTSLGTDLESDLFLYKKNNKSNEASPILDNLSPTFNRNTTADFEKRSFRLKKDTSWIKQDKMNEDGVLSKSTDNTDEKELSNKKLPEISSSVTDTTFKFDKPLLDQDNNETKESTGIVSQIRSKYTAGSPPGCT